MVFQGGVEEFSLPASLLKVGTAVAFSNLIMHRRVPSHVTLEVVASEHSVFSAGSSLDAMAEELALAKKSASTLVASAREDTRLESDNDVLDVQRRSCAVSGPATAPFVPPNSTWGPVTAVLWSTPRILVETVKAGGCAHSVPRKLLDLVGPVKSDGLCFYADVCKPNDLSHPMSRAAAPVVDEKSPRPCPVCEVDMSQMSEKAMLAHANDCAEKLEKREGRQTRRSNSRKRGSIGVATPDDTTSTPSSGRRRKVADTPRVVAASVMTTGNDGAEPTPRRRSSRRLGLAAVDTPPNGKPQPSQRKSRRKRGSDAADSDATPLGKGVGSHRSKRSSLTESPAANMTSPLAPACSHDLQAVCSINAPGFTMKIVPSIHDQLSASEEDKWLVRILLTDGGTNRVALARSVAVGSILSALIQTQAPEAAWLGVLFSEGACPAIAAASDKASQTLANYRKRVFAEWKQAATGLSIFRVLDNATIVNGDAHDIATLLRTAAHCESCSHAVTPDAVPFTRDEFDRVMVSLATTLALATFVATIGNAKETNYPAAVLSLTLHTH